MYLLRCGFGLQAKKETPFNALMASDGDGGKKMSKCPTTILASGTHVNLLTHQHELTEFFHYQILYHFQHNFSIQNATNAIAILYLRFFFVFE